MFFFSQFTKVDAGYTSTDYVMSMLKSQAECKYLSITNADNVYGSEVVERVLHWTPSPGQLPPDMLLAPLDSRNFAEHGTLFLIFLSCLIVYVARFGVARNAGTGKTQLYFKTH